MPSKTARTIIAKLQQQQNDIQCIEWRNNNFYKFK